MIELKNVSKSYGDRIIIDNINLSINKGQITFIVGTSGAGKTTLLNLIGGLSNTTSGKILFNGCDISNDLNEYRGKNVGFVFQDFNLISGLTIVENVQIATEIARVEKMPNEIISEVELLGISNHNQKVETLSGGEKQRVAVIRAICKEADILIADEPTGNLDTNNACIVLDMLQTMKRDKHIIVVSHDMDKARRYADRIITLSDGVIVCDELLNKENDNQQEELKDEKNTYKKKSLINTIWRLGKNSVTLRISKIISIAMVIAMAITSLTTVAYLKQSGNNISHNVNVNYLENDLINLMYGLTPNTGHMEYPFSQEEINKIVDEYDVTEYVQMYCYPTNGWLFSSKSKTSNVCIKQIKVNEFFKSRVLSNDIEGSFIAEKNEIILAADVAQQLYGEDCIGQIVTLNDGRGNSIDYKIVGINHTTNPLDKIYSFISSESLKDMLSETIEESILEHQELMDYQTEIQKVSYGGIHGLMQMVDKSEELCYGNYPDSKDEILISSLLLEQVLREFDIYTDYTYEQIIAGEITLDDINKVYSKKYVLNFNGVFPIYISGVYISDNIEMRFSDELINEMKKADPISVDIYVSNIEDVSKIKKDINEKYEFEASAQMETLKENVSMQTRFFSLALMLLGIVLVCISCALLSSFAKISVLERKKEIAIIKSLGADNPTVLCILIFDTIVIALLSYLLAIIFFCGIDFIIPLVINNSELLITRFPIGQITLISVIFAILVVLYTSLNLRKLVKQMPADLLVD